MFNAIEKLFNVFNVLLLYGDGKKVSASYVLRKYSKNVIYASFYHDYQHPIPKVLSVGMC